MCCLIIYQQPSGFVTFPKKLPEGRLRIASPQGGLCIFCCLICLPALPLPAHHASLSILQADFWHFGSQHGEAVARASKKGRMEAYMRLLPHHPTPSLLSLTSTTNFGCTFCLPVASWELRPGQTHLLRGLEMAGTGTGGTGRMDMEAGGGFSHLPLKPAPSYYICIY